MSRLSIWSEIERHFHMAKMYNRLNGVEKRLCLEFINDNDHLDFSAFALKVNRWFVDDVNKPRKHVVMWALVTHVNEIYKKENE